MDMEKYRIELLDEYDEVISTYNFDEIGGTLDRVYQLLNDDSNDKQILFRDLEQDTKWLIEDVVDFTELCEMYD